MVLCGNQRIIIGICADPEGRDSFLHVFRKSKCVNRIGAQYDQITLPVITRFFEMQHDSLRFSRPYCIGNRGINLRTCNQFTA